MAKFQSDLKLDDLVAEHLEMRLLDMDRLQEILASMLEHRHARDGRRQEHVAQLHKRAAECEMRLKRLYEAIENGVADLDDTGLKERVAGLKATRDQARAEIDRVLTSLDANSQQAFSPAMVRNFAMAARKAMRTADGKYRRDHLRALAQRVEVADNEIRIVGSKSRLLRTLAAAGGVKSAALGVPPSIPGWLGN